MNQLALFAEPASGTQSRAILDALRAGQALTPLDALERFQCFRLAARVHDLRRQGFPILEETITTATGKRVAMYRLERNPLGRAADSGG